MMMVQILALVVSCLVCVELCWAASDETSLGLLILDDPFLRKSYRNTLRRSINWAQRSYDYGALRLRGHVKFLGNFFHKEVERSTCRLVSHGVGCLLHMYTGYRWYDEYPEMDMMAAADRLGFPVILWNKDGFMPPVSEGKIRPIYTMPTMKQQARAMISFLRHFRWKEAVILTEYSGSEMVFYQMSGQVKNEFNIRTIILLSENTIADSLTLLKAELNSVKDTTKIILLFARADTTMLVFDYANSIHITGKDYIWVISPDGVAVRPPKSYPVGLLGVHFPQDEDSLKKAMESAVRIWTAGLKNMMETEGANSVVSMARPCDDDGPPNPLNEYIRFGDALSGIHLDEDGALTDTEIHILNLHSNREWRKLAEWTARDGLELYTMVWPGNRERPPPPHFMEVHVTGKHNYNNI